MGFALASALGASRPGCVVSAHLFNASRHSLPLFSARAPSLGASRHVQHGGERTIAFAGSSAAAHFFEGGSKW